MKTDKLNWLDAIRDASITIEEYERLWTEKNASSMSGLVPSDRKYRFYSRYNADRRDRAVSEYVMSAGLIRAVSDFDDGNVWVFITEDWCVDSAYSLPIVRQMAALRDDVELLIIVRDDHPEIMDRYLTNGKRSIPIFVTFDSSGSEIFRWGPKPNKLVAAKREFQASGAGAREVSTADVEWYADEGWLEIESELISILSGPKDG